MKRIKSKLFKLEDSCYCGKEVKNMGCKSFDGFLILVVLVFTLWDLGNMSTCLVVTAGAILLIKYIASFFSDDSEYVPCESKIDLNLGHTDKKKIIEGEPAMRSRRIFRRKSPVKAKKIVEKPKKVLKKKSPVKAKKIVKKKIVRKSKKVVKKKPVVKKTLKVAKSSGIPTKAELEEVFGMGKKK